ncbi:hypothetical protein B7494_g7451 [Chlorociboria aeruginascens]|nr:hypothetical protein B7494_g7451 [Chlorociboria aeruginascens]
MSFLATAASFLALSGLVTSLPASDNISATNAAASVLSSMNIKPPGPIQIGSPKFTCQVLQVLFPANETFTASSSFYTPLLEVPWTATCWQDPACIVTPKTEVEVSKIMIILSTFKTKFAIRSAGHNNNPNFNNIGSDGVLIALQNFNQMSMSKDTKTLTVGPGQQWGPVYEYTGSFGVTVLGGRVPSVGVGGLLLGGGLSIFYNTYGVSFSRITRYRVVLTNGKIIDATGTENADLYHALKGGMQNFGVVTEFDLQTIPNSNDIYYEIYLFPTNDTAGLLEAVANWTNNPNTDPKANIELQVMSDFNLLFLGYSQHTQPPPDFLPFRKFTPSTTIFGPTNGTINDVVNSPAADGPPPGNTYTVSYTHKVPDSTFLLEAYNIWLNSTSQLQDGMVMSFNPQSVLPNFVQQSNANNGGNLWNLEPVPQLCKPSTYTIYIISINDLTGMDIIMDWPDSKDDQLAFQLVDDFAATASNLAAQKGLALPFFYANDAAGYQKILRAYGDSNFNYIKSVAAKYDPAGIMQTLQNSGFLQLPQPKPHRHAHQPPRTTPSELRQRPLYDPDPSTLVLPRLLQTTELRQARLSDHVVGALKFAQAARFITGKQGDLFETVFTIRNKSMSIRVARDHEGHPFRAPDGTIMKIGGLVMKGNTNEGPGNWGLENVQDCVGYEEWRAAIFRETLPEDLKALENTPFPPAETLLDPIEYPPKKAKRSMVVREEDAVDAVDANDEVAGHGMEMLEQQERHNPIFGRSLSGYEQDIENILSQGSVQYQSDIAESERPAKKSKTRIHDTAKPNPISLQQPKALSQPIRPAWMTEPGEDWMVDSDVDFMEQPEEDHFDNSDGNGYLMRMRPLRDSLVKEMKNEIRSAGRAAEKGGSRGVERGIDGGSGCNY